MHVYVYMYMYMYMYIHIYKYVYIGQTMLFGDRKYKISKRENVLESETGPNT